jgi:hypothetical protein
MLVGIRTEEKKEEDAYTNDTAILDVLLETGVIVRDGCCVGCVEEELLVNGHFSDDGF